jgi:hypothetical protein
MEADRADGADGASGEYRVLETVKVVRTCQNLLGQDGICLGLLLLHVGPNSDEFGGQAFMEHYTTTTTIRSDQPLPSLANLPGLSPTTPHPTPMPYPPQATAEDTLTGILFPLLCPIPKFGKHLHSTKFIFIFISYFLFYLEYWLQKLCVTL